MSNPRNDTITAVEGVRVGHASDTAGGTGVTVILFDRPARGAVDMTGMATSTRQIDSLDMMHPGVAVHGLCLAGGSAFGLDAASGVSRWLVEQGVGLDLVVARVPVVPTAVIFDLSFMDPQARPTPDMAYDACRSASSAPVEQGCAGAGTGATCGKLRGVANATKSGLGSSLVVGADGVLVGALVVANPFGDILDGKGVIVAGAREGDTFLDMHETIAGGEVRERFGSPGNTTLCVLATNARLDKVGAMQVARMAGQGLSRHIVPFNTPFDGDMVFCFSVGEVPAHPLHLGVIAAQAAGDALMNAVHHACGMGGIPAPRDLPDR
ncbi:MAG TPA: P1 family peptidase [Deltaproteobacteria bacterium]|nr:P1 family peptidase [Deltaproteobacteria bacterium]HPR56457.1 P1 family peptidase [Deltaproteobacteria bacterium]